ncbi:hypothetical protein [Sphingomonas oligophenolica]|uniref:hypothetical protein n=1 Tax=Sphingomonas oligophenolica TaxID=301154 RepID=UPI00112D2B8A|nr:hypothetical protein [Sphingomonas oligophenolica]
MSDNDDRRASDRRQADDPYYSNEDRRVGERRQPVAEMDDAAVLTAYEQTDGEGPRARELLSEIERRGLDL